VQVQVRAQLYLGQAYFLGEGAPQDDAKALRWFRAAAAQGSPEAQVALGAIYEKGEAVAQDNAKAVNWYRKAALQGNSVGQFYLAEAYYFGKGVQQNFVEAYVWYYLAAAQREKGAAKMRDAVAQKLTPSDLTNAHKLVRERKPKN
jgi:TPR repeat protein